MFHVPRAYQIWKTLKAISNKESVKESDSCKYRGISQEI